MQKIQTKTKTNRITSNIVALINIKWLLPNKVHIKYSCKNISSTSLGVREVMQCYHVHISDMKIEGPALFHLHGHYTHCLHGTTSVADRFINGHAMCYVYVKMHVNDA